MEKTKNHKRSIEIPPPTFQDIRYAILYGYRRNFKPMEIFNECQGAYGENAPSLTTITKWYRRFQSGNFSVEDENREGRPKTSTNNANVALVKLKIDQDPKLTEKVIADELGLNAMAVSRILKHRLGYTKKSEQWVPMGMKEEEEGINKNDSSLEIESNSLKVESNPSTLEIKKPKKIK